eukprot:NODE_877_length_1330_cov_43.408627.p3 GENE.NODE_877_length_1330_cov_43.408627~~NODE_877_length_1330_cov_43.408627.p3  ORF type:complete len:156 (+),score=37.12 NODE_877_length_1330_cov_43.408627:3-470(+)
MGAQGAPSRSARLPASLSAASPLAMESLAKALANAAKAGGPVLVGGATLLGGATFIQSSIYAVDAGHLAIKYNRLTGVGSDVYREGIHFRLPWFERPIIFDVRVRPHTINSLTGSRDLQMVNISVRSLCKPDSTRLPEIYRNLGPDYYEKVLPPS